MQQLPEPSFIDRDPNQVTAGLIALYEATTGKTLQPAQPEMLLINLIAYRETLVRIAVQEAAKQNLLQYAIFPMLDYLGELVGCDRLPEQPAKTTLRFTLVAAQTFDLVVAAGTRVESKDGKQTFATDMALTIPAGQTTGDVVATDEVAGIAGNGYLAGEVNNLLDSVAYVQGASNTTTTAAGADAESDNNYRERIKTAPESYSVAGSKGAYKYWAKSAHQDIVDVAIISPSGGVVNIYPLTTAGTPSQAILDAVDTICSAETVRPLGDLVTVLAPTRKTFTIAADITLYASADQATVLSTVNAALAVYTADLRSTLGRDVVTSRIVALINGVGGVYKTVLTNPVADVVNELNEWSDCTAITVNVVGVVEG